RHLSDDDDRQNMDAMSVDDNQPLFIFEVRDAKEKFRKFVAIKPSMRNTRSLTGRCTRCYKVWDPETKAVLFMKDTWRVSKKGILQEGEIYSQMKKARVRNVLTVVTYGDVYINGVKQRTHTNRFDLKNKNLRCHYHTRLVFEECGKDIRKANSVREMVTAIRDGILGAGFLHRDISVGNIIVMPDGTGRLIDWDLSEDRKDPTSPHQRTGTWQFISAKLLISSIPKHVLADDLESFYHVLS
ncbi:hypothetical protein L218DRAFT_872049, partial [Marasmius fiardii PR-910]